MLHFFSQVVLKWAVMVTAIIVRIPIITVITVASVMMTIKVFSVVMAILWVESMLILYETAISGFPRMMEVVIFVVHVSELIMSAAIVDVLHRMVHLRPLAIC